MFKLKIAIILAASMFFTEPSEAADFKQPPLNVNWKLYVPALKTPPRWSSPTPFSKACLQSLQNRFCGTSYQVVAVEGNKLSDSSSGKKRDLFVEVETSPNSLKAKTNDTLILWLKFRTGLKYSRMTILPKKDQLNTLPDSIADIIYQTVQMDFFGELNLQGGPGGCTMTIPELLTTTPPCKVQLPAGVYEVVTTYPNFITRRDSVTINPGEVLQKRVLLLPIEQ
jgi:hypothetical protein